MRRVRTHRNQSAFSSTRNSSKLSRSATTFPCRTCSTCVVTSSPTSATTPRPSRTRATLTAAAARVVSFTSENNRNSSTLKGFVIPTVGRPHDWRRPPTSVSVILQSHRAYSKPTASLATSDVITPFSAADDVRRLQQKQYGFRVERCQKLPISFHFELQHCDD